MTLQVRQEEISQVWSDWETLLTRRDLHTVFETPLWHKIWWQELGEGEDLCVVSVRDGDELIGIAPFMRQGTRLVSMGDPELWDYQLFVMDPRREEDFYEQLFGYLGKLDWTQIELSSIPDTSGLFRHIPGVARSLGYEVDIVEQDVSPGIVLPKTWDDYLLGLSKKNRHELRRKLRRLEAEGSYNFYNVNVASALDQPLDDFFHLMRSSSNDKALFLTPERERFFRRVAEGFSECNMLKLFFLDIGGKRVASALCFDYRNVMFLYNSGYDPDYGSLSVGLLVKTLCLKTAIERGDTYFDFLRGPERYKYDLGASDVRVYRMNIHR